MTSSNKVLLLGLIGNLQPFYEYDNDTSSICFTLLCEQGEHVNEIPCVAWNKIGEIVNARCAEGTRVYLEGRINTYKGFEVTVEKVICL